ncbi:hypothetical protein [Bradyrhizobium sp. 187]|jgi:hypothetical protein|nr:hypothetical protein [Bradyrhizobium sp. 187]UPJ71061.1 hypothetical protein IVB19_25845 [Bradyrhizobium sp. 187]
MKAANLLVQNGEDVDPNLNRHAAAKGFVRYGLANEGDFKKPRPAN